MDFDKRISLIKTLLQKTDEGEIAWEKTMGKNAFQVVFPHSSIKIIEEDDDGLSSQYFLVINNSDGDLTDNLSYLNLSEKFPDVHEVLRDLYTKARSIALNADNTIDEILNDLK
jgi:hypothetical protein